MFKKIFLLIFIVLSYQQSNAQAIMGITEKVYDINPGTDRGSSPQYFYPHNGRLYFSAADSNGRELWVTDGTPGNATLLKDINPGAGSSNPAYFQSFNGKLYFTATDTANVQLWVTDGTPAGTQKLSTAWTMYELFPFGNIMLFCGRKDNGYELWKTDGTSSGTQEVMDIYQGPGPSFPAALSKLRGVAMFTALTTLQHGNPSTWKTDSTGSSGIQMFSRARMLSIYPDIQYKMTGRRISATCEMNGELYFAGTDSIHNTILFKTDGTTTGTVPLINVTPTYNYVPPYGFRVYNGKLYYGVYIGQPGKDGLWVTDGTVSGTKRVVPGLEVGRTGLTDYAEQNGILYFTSGSKLFTTNGTDTGTKVLPNSPENAQLLTIMNGHLFCFGSDASTPSLFTLFSIDNTGNVYQVSPSFSHKKFQYLHADTMGRSIYFLAALESDTNDVELWRFTDTMSAVVGVNVIPNKVLNTIYPNPATNTFSIKNIAGKHTMVYVYSLSGQLLLQSAKTENVDIAQLPAGIYTVQVISDGVVSVGKLQKQ